MKLAIRRFYIVSGLIALILATIFLLLISRAPANRSPQVRLQRLTLLEKQTMDFRQSIDWTAYWEWLATFQIGNSGHQSIGYDNLQVLGDLAFVNNYGQQTAPFAGSAIAVGDCVYVGRAASKQLLRIPVPPEAKLCRFRIVYWPMTVGERWQVFCMKSTLAQKYPWAFDWVWEHLPNKRRTQKVLLEVPLPTEPGAVEK